MRNRRWQRGQASVEFVAAIPLIVLFVAVAWQGAIAGQAVWLAGSAARKAARAHAVEGDALRAARSVLAGEMREGARVTTESDGTVRVAVPVPLIIGGGRIWTVNAKAHFEPQAS
jgi:hypothetical protein